MKLSFDTLARYVVTAIIALASTACDHIDSNRIPPSNVAITFTTIGEWERYGVSGAGQYRRFIKGMNEPAGYTYSADEYTGFGGVLLVADPNGEFLAYDLACPVEAKATIRVYVDTESSIAGVARCPECGSTYNLYGQGGPMSGKALDYKYGLQRYQVFVGSPTIPYARILR